MKTLSAMLIFSALAAGQSNDTVFEQAFANQNMGVSANSAAFRNLGQQFNQLAARATSIGPGTTCNTGNALGGVQLQASYTRDSGYFNIGSPIKSTNGATLPWVDSTKYITVPGSFPYVRASYTNETGSISTCYISVWYTGTSTGSPTSSAVTTTNDNFFYYATPVSSSAVVNVIGCLNPMIYGIQLTTGTPATPATVYLAFDNSIGTAFTIVAAINLTATNPNFSSQSGPRPILRAPNAAATIFKIWIPAFADGPVYPNVTYRCEDF